jgi:hypothetical protein
MLLKKGVERQKQLYGRFSHAITLRPTRERENAHLRIQVRRAGLVLMPNSFSGEARSQADLTLTVSSQRPEAAS